MLEDLLNRKQLDTFALTETKPNISDNKICPNFALNRHDRKISLGNGGGVMPICVPLMLPL